MKKIFVAFLLTMLVFSITACQNNSTVDISASSAIDVAVYVKESISFLDDMLEVKNEIVADFYSLPEGITEMKAYMSSSGATAEELVIFKCADTETADAVIKSCEKRLEDLKEKFEDYIPEEMVKIENAIIQKRDCFVMFVCADNTDPAVESFENYK